MKHLYASLFVLFSFSSAIAQIPIERASPSPDQERSEATAAPSILNQRSAATEAIQIGSASNIFTILNVDQNQVHYSPELDVVTFVHRQNTGEFEEGGSGTVRYDVSYDQGASWTVNTGPMTPQLISTSEAIPIETDAGPDFVRGCRYPNGLIYNPPGNTALANASYVATGPCLFQNLGGETGWGVNFFSSQKLDGSDAVDQYNIALGNDSLGGNDGFPTSLVQSGDALHAVSEEDLGPDILMWKGVPTADGTSFDWTPTEIEVDWAPFDTDGITYTGYQNLAFSADGSIGYMVLGGATNNQPDGLFGAIVYATTDNGDTWTLVSDDFDIGQTESGDALDNLVYMRNFDTVIDADNKLHIFAEVMQSSEDNLTFFYEGYMVDYIFDGSAWEEIIIGEIENSEQGVFLNSFQDLYAHPQVSISADRTKIIYAWLTSVEQEINDDPDLFARGLDTVTGNLTELKMLTEGTDAEQAAYYATCSPTLITGGADFEYELPAVCFIDWSGDNLDEVDFFYLNGIGFNEVDFNVGVQELDSPFASLNLYPNPASGSAIVAYTLKDAAEVSIRLIDGQGQLVEVLSSNQQPAGSQFVDLALDRLSAGIYFVEIEANNRRTTKRLTVTK